MHIKASLLALLLALSLSGLAQSPTYIDLPTALQQNLVEVKPAATGGLGRQNLRLKIKSLLKKALHLKIPPGLHFSAKDNAAQDLFTTQEVLLSLEPHTEKVVYLQGFCMHATRYSPPADGLYQLQGYARLPLKVLGDTLARYQPLADEWGQMFVWAITDQRSLHPVYADSAYLRPAAWLMAHAAAASGQRGAEVLLKEEGSLPSVEIFSKKGVLAFHNPTDQMASFGLYDARGNKLYAYYDNRPLTHGLKHYTFGVNEVVAAGSDPVYWAKVVAASGQVLAQLKVDKNTQEVEVHPQLLNFTFQFELRQPLKRLRLNLYLKNGTLVEEFKRYNELGPGSYDLYVQFMHLQVPQTPFVAKLVDESGKVWAQQLVKPAR